MDEPPLVCCILPYHIPDYYQQAIACFEQQTYTNKQLLAVDTSAMPRIHGLVRNNLIARTPKNCLIAHWDHDDWSCPTRLTEQVEFIKASGASVVGYRDMPFYDVRTQQVTLYRQPNPHFALGTSLMYRRETWEQHPFIETLGDEDSKFLHSVGFGNVATRPSVLYGALPHIPPMVQMIARIHPGNTSPKGGARYEKATPELTTAVKACLSPCIVAQ